MVDTSQSIESRNTIAGGEDYGLSALLEPDQSIDNRWSTEPVVSESGLNLEDDEEFPQRTSGYFAEASETEEEIASHRLLSDLLEEPDSDEKNVEDFRIGENYEEKYRFDSHDDFYDTDNEEEEEICDSLSSSDGRARLEDEAERETEETEREREEVDFLADFPAEILRDRRALVEKLRETKDEEPHLRRKNRLYQYWVARVMSKKQQKMRPEDQTLSSGDSENRYISELLSYKTSVDEIEARQGEIKVELGNLENSLKTVIEEDNETFGGLLDRQREIGVGLVYEKSAKVLSVKAIEAMIRRQILRRDLLNRDRLRYIVYRRRFEDLKSEIRRVETLGNGMTILDYEILRSENYSYKEKLEDREKNLEKLCINIQSTLTTLANYKEKDVANVADIRHEKIRLESFQSKVIKTRAGIVTLHETLLRIRTACESNKRKGGLLFALPALREMEKSLKTLEDLKSEVERAFPQVKSFLEDSRADSSRADRNLKVDETRTAVTRMTKVKRSSLGSKKPGRC